jgi:chromosome partitioning protein
MASIVTFVNPKGGVGKSTASVQTALTAAALELAVLLIDTEGGSAARWVHVAGDAWPPNVAFVTHYTPDLPRRLPSLAMGYDVVIIDTPSTRTHEGTVVPSVVAALAVADLAIIPTRAAALDVDRLPAILRLIEAEKMRRDLDHGVLLNFVDARRHTAATARKAFVDRGLPVLTNVVPARARIEDAVGEVTPRHEFLPAAREILERLLVPTPAA